MSLTERRLWRETNFGLSGKLWQISWLYVLLLCAVAGVGYLALYSAAGGSAEPYAGRHAIRFAFGLTLMLGHRADRHPLPRPLLVDRPMPSPC